MKPKRRRSRKSGPPEASSTGHRPRPSAPNPDRITNLAPELIEQIFLGLPIKDAIRTSALSRSWRSRWHSAVRHLDFNQWLILEDDEARFQGAVTGVLDAVTGPIDSFKLSAKHPDKNIPRWMVRALALGVTAFDVSTSGASRALVLPKAFFSCRGLTRLRLQGFKVRFPPGFQGFKGLTALELYNCEVFPEGVLDRLVAGSSSLTELHIIYVEKGCTYLEVSSASLCSFSVWSTTATERFTMKSCPNLKSASVGINTFCDDCSIAELLHGPCSNLRDLKLDSHFFHDCRPPKRLPHELCQLRKLELDFNVAWRVEVEVLFCILRSAPALQRLRASYRCDDDDDLLITDTAVDFWEDGEWQGLTLNELSSVELVCASRASASRKAHLNFCKFLFANSPMLQDFFLCVRHGPMAECEENEILRYHSALPMASKNLKMRIDSWDYWEDDDEEEEDEVEDEAD